MKRSNHRNEHTGRNVSSVGKRKAQRTTTPKRARPVRGKRNPNAAALEWAREQLAALAGHAARVRCWVTLLALAVENPSGTITDTFASDAERQAMYGQIENEAVTAEWLAEAFHRSTARNCARLPFVIVPLDGCCLRITDTKKTKGTGPASTHTSKARGVQVMNAIAVAPDGTPIGNCAQIYFTRREKRVRTHRRKRSVKDKETRYWLDAIRYVISIFREEAPNCTPIFQLDRGGDAGDVLQMLLDEGVQATVRVAHNRRARVAQGRTARVWNVVRRLPALGTYALEVPAAHARRARTAKMVVRATKLTLQMPGYKTSTRRNLTINAVHTVEVGTTPKREKRLEWLLYSTRPIKTLKDAFAIIHGYESRWSIEEFHKTWKSGLCNVEDTQIRNIERIKKWATLMSSIAMRAQRIKSLSRTTPAVPATEEYSRDEIDAVILLLRPRGYRLGGRVPTMETMTHWIAGMGGWNKWSGGPPGQIVISRGLIRIEAVAAALAAQREMKSES
jgi:hypothetical protein